MTHSKKECRCPICSTEKYFLAKSVKAMLSDDKETLLFGKAIVEYHISEKHKAFKGFLKNIIDNGIEQEAHILTPSEGYFMMAYLTAIMSEAFDYADASYAEVAGPALNIISDLAMQITDVDRRKKVGDALAVVLEELSQINAAKNNDVISAMIERREKGGVQH